MNDIQLPDDLQRCVAFHGHLCPGVVIGYCAAKLGMELLAAERAEDEELIAIVENDTCAVDAVQVLTGCTFGKGNLFFRDYGKMVFTFALRPSGKSVRLCLIHRDPDAGQDVPEDQRRRRRIEFMLSESPTELFEVRRQTLSPMPEQARIRESATCEQCGERMMATRARQHAGRTLCIPCAEKQPPQKPEK